MVTILYPPWWERWMRLHPTTLVRHYVLLVRRHARSYQPGTLIKAMLLPACCIWQGFQARPPALPMHLLSIGYMLRVRFDPGVLRLACLLQELRVSRCREAIDPQQEPASRGLPSIPPQSPLLPVLPTPAKYVAEHVISPI